MTSPLCSLLGAEPAMYHCFVSSVEQMMLTIHNWTNGLLLLFTARRYASAVLAVVVCPSVRHKPVFYRNDYI